MWASSTDSRSSLSLGCILRFLAIGGAKLFLLGWLVVADQWDTKDPPTPEDSQWHPILLQSSLDLSLITAVSCVVLSVFDKTGGPIQGACQGEIYGGLALPNQQGLPLNLANRVQRSAGHYIWG